MIKKKDFVDCIEQMKGKAVADTQILNLCCEIVNLSAKFKGSWILIKDSPVNELPKNEQNDRQNNVKISGFQIKIPDQHLEEI